MFWHYCVILRELVVVPCQVTQVCQMQLLVIQFKIIAHGFSAVEISMFKILTILKLSYLKSNYKLYYQQLHLTYLCNLARYYYKLPENDTIVSKHVGGL
jgi:hypothetical protein